MYIKYTSDKKRCKKNYMSNSEKISELEMLTMGLRNEQQGVS